MAKIDLINEVESMINDKILNIDINGVSFKTLLETQVMNSMKDTATFDDLKNLVFNDLIPKAKKTHLNGFIKSNFPESLFINGIDVIKLLTRLKLDDDLNVQFGPKKISLEEFILKIYNNYNEVSNKRDKLETINYILEKLNVTDDILNFKESENSMTFKEIIDNRLTGYMDTATTVKFDDEIRDIDVVLIDKVNDIKYKLELRKEEEKLDKFNRTSENPNLVQLIDMEVDELTGEFKIVDPSETNTLDSSEVEVVSKFSPTGLENDELLFAEIFNNSIESVKYANSQKDLDAIIDANQDLLNQQFGSERIDALSSSLNEEINNKKINLIKRESNKEDFIDATIGRIKELKNSIDNFASEDDFAILNGKIVAMELELEKNNVVDSEVAMELNNLKDFALKKQIIFDNSRNNVDYISNKYKMTLDELIRRVKSTVIDFENETNYGVKSGMEIRLKFNISEVDKQIDQYFDAGIINEKEKNDFKNKLNEAIEMNNKKVFGR